MNSEPSLAPSPGAEARPVDAGERLALLDTLRGFALFGVFVSNVYMWFSGRAFLPRAQIEAAVANASLLDTVTMQAFMVLVFGKFITIFSFLFGLGFAVQLGRAEARGAPIGPVYSRRLLVMLGIGLLHLFLLWYGDILSTYALLGFGLLLFRGRSNRTLLIGAAVCILVVPVLGTLVLRWPQLMADTAEAGAAIMKAQAERSAGIKAQALAAFTSGSWWDVVRASAHFYIQDFLPMLYASTLAIFGRFLLGLLAGRHRIFHEPSNHRGLFRKLILWGLVAGVIGSGAQMVLQQLMLRKIVTPEALPVWLPFPMAVLRHVGEVGFASVYVSGITLLFQRETWQRVLGVLAPVGRMALTNYLAQTVMSLLIFNGYGLGLVTKVGPAMCFAICLGVFCVQVVWSHLWLARFRFGPAEWVWRSLTYGKAQPMRRESPAGAEATAGA